MEEIRIPEIDTDYLNEKKFDYKVIGERNSQGKLVIGIIIQHFKLPEGKYNYNEADLLILLPDGYPDVKIDMFYFNPHLLLNSTGKPVYRADVNHNFNGVAWQRWSKHMDSKDWRPGVDGLHSYLKLVEYVISEADK